MKNLLLTLSLSLAVLPAYADEMSPTKGTDLPPPRTTAPQPTAVPSESAPAEVAPPAKAAAAMPAKAAPAALAARSTWYVGGDLGWNKTNDVEWGLQGAWIDSHPVPFDDGWVGALKVGTYVAGIRAELEYAHRSNDAKEFGPLADVDNARGSIKSDALMLNAYYDFTPTGRITPYVGAGVGAARVEANNIRKALAPTDCCSGIVDDKDTVAALQVMAGAAYAVNSNLDVTAEYRYFLSQDPSFNYATGCDPSESVSTCGVLGKVSDNYNNHSILVGLRYRF